MCSVLSANIIQTTVLFCHDCCYHLVINALLCMKFTVDKSLRNICHYERNVQVNAFSHTQWTRTRHISIFGSGKREVDVNHNSDYHVTF